MLTELKRLKFIKLFTIYDANDNGVLEKADFERIVKNLGNLRGWQSGTVEYDNLHDRYLFYWQSILELADQNHNGRVSLPEWLNYHEKMLGTKEQKDKYEKEVETIAALVCDVFDLDGDGKLNIEEWKQLFLVYNTPHVVVEEIFPKLDIDGDGFISKQEMQRLFHEFHFSDDQAAPGNLLFGTY
jgi:juvenile hormone diol kinase